jgi:hypothetical protein
VLCVKQECHVLIRLVFVDIIHIHQAHHNVVHIARCELIQFFIWRKDCDSYIAVAHYRHLKRLLHQPEFTLRECNLFRQISIGDVLDEIARFRCAEFLHVYDPFCAIENQTMLPGVVNGGAINRFNLDV